MTMLEIAGSILLSIGIIGMIGIIITIIFMFNPFRNTSRRLNFFFLLFTIAYCTGMFGALAMSIIYEFIK
jgi:hypothetical protein